MRCAARKEWSGVDNHKVTTFCCIFLFSTVISSFAGSSVERLTSDPQRFVAGPIVPETTGVGLILGLLMAAIVVLALVAAVVISVTEGWGQVFDYVRSCF